MSAFQRVLGAAALAVAAGLLSTVAHAGGGHRIISAADIEWKPGPASLPAGAEAAVLYGDPAAEGLFAMRLKLPEGYHIAPHTHPKPEVVTVISGTFRLGMGEIADADSVEALGPGAIIALDPGMAHYVYADEEVVVQLNSTGPWAITYVDPADDPRKTN